MNTKYWLIVASKNHVQRGVSAGFAQANHGKASPLRRMSRGDWVIFYSPKQEFEGNEKCQAFTAIGKVVGDVVYPFDMGGGFVPFRRDVEFASCQETPILPLIPTLSFIKDKKNWGQAFRFGFFEMPASDFELISSQMLGTPGQNQN
jgi:hypothetical protein